MKHNITITNDSVVVSNLDKKSVLTVTQAVLTCLNHTEEPINKNTDAKRASYTLTCRICGAKKKGRIGMGIHLKRAHQTHQNSPSYLNYNKDATPVHINRVSN